MRSDDDLTLRLAVRYWMNSAYPDCNLLRLLIVKIYPPHLFSAEDEGTIQAATSLFDSLQRGAGSFRRFFSKFETVFSKVRCDDAGEAIILLSRLCFSCIHYTPRRPDIESESGFLRTMIKSITLWSSFFLFLRRTAEDLATSSIELATPVYELALQFLTVSLDKVTTHFRAESGGFVGALVRSGMFDALDVAVPLFGPRSPAKNRVYTVPAISGYHTYNSPIKSSAPRARMKPFMSCAMGMCIALG